MSDFSRPEVQPADGVSPVPPPNGPDQVAYASTPHDITRHAMGDEAALERLIRLERSRNRWGIRRFVAKIAALTVSLVIVVHAARGIDVNVPAAVWPALSVVGASLVTAAVTLAGGRLLGRRGTRADEGTGEPGRARDGEL